MRKPCNLSSSRFTKWSLVGSFLATAVVSTAQSASFPNYPLQTGTRTIPPNILFILDDSGSMADTDMPDNPERIDPLNIAVAAYTRNTLAYNPNTTYQGWRTWDGGRMTDGRSITSAFSSSTHASGGKVDLTDNFTPTYYQLKTPDSDQGSTHSYWRYQIRKVDGTIRVVRSEYRARKGAEEGVQNADCGSGDPGWYSCTFVDDLAAAERPGGRSEANELINYATWYSYHRTRSKVAKAGASEAFADLGENYRVGFDSIWNRNGSTSVPGSRPAYPIPVGDDDGLFRGENKKKWFSYLHNANASSGTPLHGALQRAGMYYEEKGDNGPWGGKDQLSCRQSYSILTTDGYWNNSSGFTSVGNVDNKAASVLAPDGSVAYQYTPSAPFKDAYSDTLADVAMHYWLRDLRTDLSNNVPMSASDRAFWQHMVTFGISIGLKGTQDPAALAASGNWLDPWNGKPGTWSGENARRIDDLLHASINGRGRFVAATDPQAFAKALTESLADIAGREASGSNVASNGAELQAGSRIFQAVYTSGAWSGDVMAFPIGSKLIQDRIWSAADKARQNRAAFVDRKILTWNGSGGDLFPTLSQEKALERKGGMTPVSAEDNVKYIRGSAALEAAGGLGKLRDRASPIGDIVNSSPVLVESGGTSTLYVGANDGMLHGIDAASGQTLFSYVPAGISLTNLANLSNPEYDHRFFVDGGLDVATTSDDKKILVGALGRGGKGVFALDVSSAAALTGGQKKTVLWDQTAANDSDMGHVLGAPLVLPDDAGGTITFVGNGIDSSSGEAVLFAYLTGKNGALTTIRIRTGAKGDNGLAEPRAADVDGDGTVDYVYAGDLQGNLWKFDVRGAAGTWAGKSPTVLFKAIGPDGKAQAITAAPALAREPVTRRLFIVFGTGRYIADSDITGEEASRVQTVYGVIDEGSAIASRNELQRRTIVKAGKDSKGRNARAWEPYAPLGTGKKGWYVDLELPTAGERVITRPLVLGRAMWFSSIIPSSGEGCESGGSGYLNAVDAFTGTNPSRGTNAGGGTYTYIDVNDNKKGDDKLVGESADGNDGYVTSVDLGIGMPSRGTNVGEGIYVCGSDGSCGWVPTAPKPARAQRVSWRELVGEG